MNNIGVTLGKVLHSASKVNPNQEAIVTPELRLTFRDYEKVTNQLAHYLLDKGVKQGDRVVFVNGVNGGFPLILMAIAKIGAIATPINYHWSVELVEWVIDHLEASFIIFEDQFYSLFAKAITSKKIPHLLFIENHQIKPNFLSHLAKFPNHPPNIDISPSDPVTILFTSGTTGKPKGVVSSHQAYFAASIAARVALETKPGDRFLLSTPIFHISGILFMLHQFLYGYTLVFLPTLKQESLLQIIEAEKISLMFLPPSLLSILLPIIQQSDLLLSSLQRIISGGTKAPVSVILGFEEMGFEIIEAYGSTETNGIVSCWQPRLGYDKAHTVGKPFILPEVKVLDPESKEELPLGEVGELAISSPQMFSGYYKDKEMTKKVFHNGWFLTGDAARLDEEGFIEIVDRYKDIIFFAGFGGIYPSEVEKVIRELEGIKEVSVVGIQHKNWGEIPCAFVTLDESVTFTTQEILDYVHQILERHKLAEVIILPDSLPLNATGKIDKKQLRLKYEQVKKSTI